MCRKSALRAVAILWGTRCKRLSRESIQGFDDDCRQKRRDSLAKLRRFLRLKRSPATLMTILRARTTYITRHCNEPVLGCTSPRTPCCSCSAFNPAANPCIQHAGADTSFPHWLSLPREPYREMKLYIIYFHECKIHVYLANWGQAPIMFCIGRAPFYLRLQRGHRWHQHSIPCRSLTNLLRHLCMPIRITFS